MDKLNLTRLLLRDSPRTRRRPGGKRTGSGKVAFESRIREGASLADIDLELAEAFLKDTAVGDRSGVDMLRAYGLIRGTGPDWKITNAALLLFACAPARHWHPGAGIRVIRVAGTARILGHRQSVTRIGYAGPPLASAIDESFRLAGAQVRFSEPLRHVFFQDVPEYPESAWGEALLNAVAHRDYEGTSEIEVVFYDDRLEVTSPGLPLEPVSAAGVTDGLVVSRTRNPLLNRVLADAGFMKGKATGLVRVFKEMSKHLLTQPELAHRNGFFTITLRNEPESATSGPGWMKLVSKLRVSPDQKRILLARPDGFSLEDYQRLNSVSQSEAERCVHELVVNDIVTRESMKGEPAATYYLDADLDSQRWFLEDRIPRLREHFREQSRLGNADYRTLFETSYTIARRELDYLSEEGFLRKTGRGRAMHYMPAAGLRK